MNKRIIWAALTGLMVPYVGTLAWTGTIRGEELRYEQQKEISGRRRILLDRTSGSYYMDMEEYLPGIIARQIPVEYEPEALKAQAIIARTYICRQMEGAGNGEEIAESALDMDYLEADQLKKLWGSSRFPEYYKKLEDAVKATSGIVMTYEGKCIDPMYCRATAGMTRQGDFTHPYLQTVDCPGDVEAEGYMQMLSFPGSRLCRISTAYRPGNPAPGPLRLPRCRTPYRLCPGMTPDMWIPCRLAARAIQARRYSMLWAWLPPALCWSPMRTESGQW